MEQKRTHFRIGGLLWPLVLALVACGEQPSQTAEPVSRPVKMFTVGEVHRGQTLRFPGSVSAVQQSDMAFEVSGRIIDMPVTEGDLVKKGAILAKLDPRDYEAERARARAERNAARADFNRYNQAYKSKAVTPQQVDIARRALEVAQAGLQQADKAVEDTVLRAPFPGRIARKLVEDYANVQAKQPVLILQSDDALEMKVNMPESDWVGYRPVESAADIEDGLDIKVVISSLPDRPIPARITAFSSKADPVTRTFEVTVGFEPPDAVTVSPGMTGHVAYTPPLESTQDELRVPAGAVVATADSTPFVWLFDQASGTVTDRPVEIGKLTDGSIQILSGLEKGDRIAISGVHSLTEGFRVHPLED
jgi:RND family efflux transporter MFP subunit